MTATRQRIWGWCAAFAVCVFVAGRGDQDPNPTYKRFVAPASAAALDAGKGYADGPAHAARFASPLGVAVDDAGNVFVADTGNGAIRKVTPGGMVSTVAGGPAVRGSADGIGTAASFSVPFGIAIDKAGNLYVTDRNNHALRKITPTGAVTTFAGKPGVAGSADGVGSDASFDLPQGIAIDPAGNFYVTDRGSNTVRKVTREGRVSTLAGRAGAMVDNVDGVGSSARFNQPFGIAVGRAGELYVGDVFNRTIRKVMQDGVVTTFAGMPGGGYSEIVDGRLSEARFIGIGGPALDAAGNLYVTDTCTVRKITRDGMVTTIAGTANACAYKDATGSAARFKGAGAVAVDRRGAIYVADSLNHCIRKVSPAGQVTTLAGMVEGR